MPLQATSGAASYDAFGGGAAAVPQYIEDVFNVWLHTGSSSSNQTITNGIDLAGKGGLVWQKGRNTAFNHAVFDSGRSLGLGTASMLNTNTTNAEATGNSMRFDSTGFTMGVSDDAAQWASWTFRKQPKFFDVVTYTGNGAASRNIAHNLGSTPGCIIGKTLSISENWGVYHRSTGANGLYLNATNSAGVTGVLTGHTSTTFEVGNGYGIDNSSGVTYVAYLFAHNAGGFGLTGTDNVISCGSYTGNGSATGPIVTLGYEPQWLLTKRSSGGTSNWFITDVMRGMPVSGNEYQLYPNLSSAESYDSPAPYSPTATGFQVTSSGSDYNASGSTYIYIAIRRGPMKVPTDATKVFNPSFNGQTSTDYLAYLGQPTDFWIRNDRAGSDHNARSRLTGGGYLLTNSTAAEGTQAINWWDNQFGVGEVGTTYGYSTGIVNYLFRRAPSFFDEVCYTGTGGASQTFTHNLGVAPELVIVKNRSDAAAWESLGTALTASQRQIYLNRTQAGVAVASGHLGWNGTDGAYKAPTSTLVYFGGDSDVGGSGLNYVAYLFATCAGVSKVGSYTGNGSSQTINCGFTAGARFVLIKATSTTGDWMVADSARGIVSGNDPYIDLNNTNVEVTGEDWLDTDSTGFVVNEVSGSNANTNGATYIFLAIA